MGSRSPPRKCVVCNLQCFAAVLQVAPGHCCFASCHRACITTSHNIQAVSCHDHVPGDSRDTSLRSITSCCQVARPCSKRLKSRHFFKPQSLKCCSNHYVLLLKPKIQFMDTTNTCLSLLATYDAVSGSPGFFDQVDDETSVQTALNDSLKSSARSKRCSIQCRSRCPLTQRGSSNFDVCGIWLGGVFVKRRA